MGKFPLSPFRREVSRRLAVKGVAGFTIGAGLKALDLDKIAVASAQSCCEDDTPQLDGDYLVDEASRRVASFDYGRSIHRLPLAVARPRSVNDVARIVQYANETGLKIAVRGQGHSLSGQTLVDAGIVIDSSSLNHVGLVSNDAVDAQAGALWSDVARTTLKLGQLPPVMPDALVLSVGGTLSVGGLGETSYRFGAQVDHVRELDVVTGEGEFVTCSQDRCPELFAMTLAGLGQCGIIVRARLDLQPIEMFVVTHTLAYPDVQTLLSDQAGLTEFAGPALLNARLVPHPNNAWDCLLTVGFLVANATLAAQTSERIKELHHSGATEPVLVPIWQYLDRRTANITARKLQTNPNPSLVLSLPAAATGSFVADILGSRELSAGIWYFEISPKIPARHTMPLQKMPAEPLAYELRMQRRASAFKSVDHRAMLLANLELATRALELGGKIYPPFAPVLSASHWQEHFGAATFKRFAAAKQRFDPNNVLNPGAGIF
jgi:cytokinin dehydrogenase